MLFEQFGLSTELVRNVRRLGYTDPTPIQNLAIPAVITGRDLVATAQTGTGKTAAFLLPVMHRMLQSPQRAASVLVLTPTRELANQIGTVFQKFASGTKLRSATIIGGANMQAQIRELVQGVNLVVATPGRLLDHLEQGWGGLANLQSLILDEADQMFDLGFFPVIKRIVGRLPKSRQTLLFSATMPPEVARLTKAVVRDPQTVSVGAQGQAADTVAQVVYPVSMSRKTQLLQHLMQTWNKPSVLVFTRTRRGCKKLTRELIDSGLRAVELHGDRSPHQRERAMQVFRNGAVRVLVATNVAARGIDISTITHVVNYDAPDAPEEYVHRIGRTGRAGEQGESLVLVSPSEEFKVASVERHVRQRIERRTVADFDYGPQSVGKPVAMPEHRQGHQGGPRHHGGPSHRNNSAPGKGPGKGAAHSQHRGGPRKPTRNKRPGRLDIRY